MIYGGIKVDIERATEILSYLADGIDPATGEVLPNEDSCNRPDVVRALNTVLTHLNASDPSKYKNAFKPWTDKDEEYLIRMFNAHASKKDMCAYFQRSPGAISARLVHLRLIKKRDEF